MPNDELIYRKVNMELIAKCHLVYSNVLLAAILRPEWTYTDSAFRKMSVETSVVKLVKDRIKSAYEN